MGQNISKNSTPPPLTLQDCLVDGKLDIVRYLYFKRRMDAFDEQFEELINPFGMKKRKLSDLDDSNTNDGMKKQRSCKKSKLLVRDEDGNLIELKPHLKNYHSLPLCYLYPY